MLLKLNPLTDVTQSRRSGFSPTNQPRRDKSRIKAKLSKVLISQHFGQFCLNCKIGWKSLRLLAVGKLVNSIADVTQACKRINGFNELNFL